MGVRVIPHDQDPRPKVPVIVLLFRFDPENFPPLPPIVHSTSAQDHILENFPWPVKHKGKILMSELTYILTLNKYHPRYICGASPQKDDGKKDGA